MLEPLVIKMEKRTRGVWWRRMAVELTGKQRKDLAVLKAMVETFNLYWLIIDVIVRRTHEQETKILSTHLSNAAV